MSNIEKKINRFKKNSILKPYLIHIENELLNLQNIFENDKMFIEIYKHHNYNIYTLRNSTKSMINLLKRLSNIL